MKTSETPWFWLSFQFICIWIWAKLELCVATWSRNEENYSHELLQSENTVPHSSDICCPSHKTHVPESLFLAVMLSSCDRSCRWPDPLRVTECCQPYLLGPCMSLSLIVALCWFGEFVYGQPMNSCWCSEVMEQLDCFSEWAAKTVTCLSQSGISI